MLFNSVAIGVLGGNVNFFQHIRQLAQFLIDLAQGVFQGIGQFVDFVHGLGGHVSGQHLFQLVVVFREVANRLFQGVRGLALEVFDVTGVGVGAECEGGAGKSGKHQFLGHR